jgi:hypothetical protein
MLKLFSSILKAIHQSQPYNYVLKDIRIYQAHVKYFANKISLSYWKSYNLGMLEKL